MEEVFTRLWENLAGRIGGPLTFRLILQPITAIVLAVSDGSKDARGSRPAYFWAIITDPAHRREMLRGGWKSVMKVFILAILIDAVYQLMASRWFYPGEALIVAFLLAIVPYLLIRGPANRILRLGRHDASAPAPGGRKA